MFIAPRSFAVPLCFFAVAFFGSVGIALLSRMGIINRRLAGILTLLLMVPFVCLVFYMVFNMLTGGPGGPWGFPGR